MEISPPLWGGCPRRGRERYKASSDLADARPPSPEGKAFYGSMSMAAKSTANSCREKGLSGLLSNRRSAVVIRDRNI